MNSLDELPYLVNLMEAGGQQAWSQNHIPLGICKICSSNFHVSDACPILLDTNICGETQVVGDLQGQYYWEQNSYFEEQPIWPYQQSQQNVSADTISYLEEAIKQMNENSLQMQSSLQSLAIQVEQIVSSVHQFQERKMLNDDVQPVALIEVMQCDTSLDETPGERIKTLFVSSDEHTNSSECMNEIIPQNSLKYDLDELYASLEVDKSFEIISCECGVCNVCHELSATILGEDILMPTTTCAEIPTNSITLEVDTKSVDFSNKLPLSIAEKLLVEHLIMPRNMQLSLTICASRPPILSDSQAKRGLSDFHTFVIADLPYVLAIPPKPPDFLLISKFTCYLLFLVSYVRSAERPPPKPPDMKATIPP
ncbi:hypothetical protein QL285_078659 [Trifolium repens]|nr:hypothetical protein QL285_078659 [Trifolium repens]